MSVLCFTCSCPTDAVSPMSNTYHWGILCSLLLPDQNIEYVCFPNPNLYLCIKCTDMLHCISEFRNVAINSVSAMLERWHHELNPLGITPHIVKLESENDIKKEGIDDQPVCDKIYNTELHEEVMLETKDEISSQNETAKETMYDTDDNQNNWGDWLLGDEHYCKEGGTENENTDWMTESEAHREDAPQQNDMYNRKKTLRSSKNAGKARNERDKRLPKSLSKKPSTSGWIEIVEDGTKMKYNMKKINTKELDTYRSEWGQNKQFRAARFICRTCLLVFETSIESIEHRIKCHTKRFNLQECIVCKQTMIGVLLAKHIASHFQLFECRKCGHLAHDAGIMKKHSC